MWASSSSYDDTPPRLPPPTPSTTSTRLPCLPSLQSTISPTTYFQNSFGLECAVGSPARSPPPRTSRRAQSLPPPLRSSFRHCVAAVDSFVNPSLHGSLLCGTCVYSFHCVYVCTSFRNSRIHLPLSFLHGSLSHRAHCAYGVRTIPGSHAPGIQLPHYSATARSSGRNRQQN